MKTNTFGTFVNGAGHGLVVGSVAGCALFALACGGLPDDVATETDPIINGNPVASDTVGTPIISTDQTCTGTMIRNDWAVTAKHCLQLHTGVLATLTDVEGSIKGAPFQNPVRIVRHPDASPTLGFDVALLKFAAPLTNTSGQAFANPLYVGADSSLVSQPVYIQGWGAAAITSCPPPDSEPSGGLRSMTAPINQMSSVLKYSMIPVFGGNGQITYKGDSGSTPFTTVSGFRRPTGVQTVATCLPNPARVNQAFFVRSDAFRGWMQGIVGTGTTGGPISGFERPDQATVIAYTNGSPAHVKWLAKGSPTAPDWTLTDFGGTPRSGTDVPSYVRGDGSGAVLYVNTSNHIIEVRPWFNGTWLSTDITADATASNVASGGHIAAYVRADNLETGESITSVVYGSSDGNIRELRWSPGAAHWVSGLLTGPGSPSGGNPVGYVRGDGVNAVIYVDTAGHIQELRQSGGGWLRTDLEGSLGVPVVASGAVPHVYTRSDGYSIVLFRDGNQDIWELAMDWNGGWGAANLTSMFSCQKAASDPYGYVRGDGPNAVVFRGAADAHVWELSLGGTWFCSDLTAAAAGAPAVGSVGPYAFVGSDLRSHVVFRSADGHVRDLLLDIQWVSTDPTQIAGGP